ncbi:MAG: tRNA (adenosine(37)-N6)-dimethylallyltransferase MiaA [Candidatus Omnitrophica bacterium CG_4_10_14_0_2_um_filter_44_9]|nr:MAG: tRNA (adenosine(37)-N6)-dimethylallyltransferase MiaA [Candidatus Omnitrophica bacterium CG_4_10_14_0_8_um_filter_44_12]PIZ84305.1 MAG: tRNA (adenosine(37)-N6)-dimethylallyltransferase MiaA [Candidatus Omnitrophica bacterium CG_4_10_14_0_2_um_filter_44_9]
MKKIVFLVGPTGVGKTEVGLKLASFLPVGFISADSMQVYKGMDIVTDKLPEVTRKKYPHYLVDILEPSHEYNVADFCSSARAAIKDILNSGLLPVVIGGTGLYADSLLYGIFQNACKDEELRINFQAQADDNGTGYLYGRLEEVDPKSAKRIGKNDMRRIIRALEVYEMTGSPISMLQKERIGVRDEYDVFSFGLRMDRQELYRRIDQRVDLMVNAGLLDEVRRLLEKKLSRTAYMCIGIRELEGFLKGRYDLNEAVCLMKQNSRRFAKRQLAWFNRNKDIDWIDIRPDEDLDKVARKIVAAVQRLKDS